MASLPAGWAADYDGTRWFFRYAATDHIQYHFPKPGDEFPEFFSPFENSDDGVLLPEERLESERQLRKRATVGGGGGGGHTRGTREERGQDEEDHGEEGSEGMFFANFGYLGPGSYEDVLGSPNVDNTAGAYELANNDRRPSVDAVSSLTSAEATTGPVSGPSNRCTFTILTNEQLQEREQQQQTRAVELPSSPPPPNLGQSPPLPHRGFNVNEIAMLDGRELDPSPVGHVAELVSESTARCEEEINPPPVELPDTNGAIWLEPMPVPNLENQYPVELPAVKHRDSLLETLGAKWDAVSGRCEDTKRSMTPAGNNKNSVNGEGKGGAWQTNWMSTSTPPIHGPPRLPTVVSRSDLPSRQSPGSQDSPEISPNDESLHQEILDFFPSAARHHHGDLPVNTDPPHAASSPPRHIKTKKPNSSPLAPHLGQFPSVLRPGPRRPSQPLPHVQHSSSPPTDQAEAASSPPSAHSAAQFKAYKPPRPQNPAFTGCRPHSQSVAEQTILPVQPMHDDVIIMPNPADHFRAPRLPRSHTLQPTEPVSSSSPVRHVPLTESAPRREALHFVIPVRHFTAPAQDAAASPAHNRTPSASGDILPEPSLDEHLPQRPSGFLKMPSEPARPVGMPAGTSPLHFRRDSRSPLEALTSTEKGVESFSASHDSHEEVHKDLSSKLLEVRTFAPLHETSPVVTTANPSEAMSAKLSERVPTSLSTMGVNTLGNNRLRHLIKRIGRLDKGQEGFSIESSRTEEAHQPLPHEYIPPKGRQREASEWSLGNAG